MDMNFGCYTVLCLTILVCVVCRQNGQNDGIFLKIKQAVYDSYEDNKTLTHNYFTLLTILCPQSVYCSKINANVSVYKGVEEFWNDENVTEYNNTVSEKIKKARKFLFETRDQLPGCCEPCSCETSCVEKQNCCPEYQASMPNTINASTHLQECEVASVKAYTSNFFFKPETLGISYFMVNRCTANASTLEHSKCLSPDKNNIEEILPYYSNLSKRIYKNKHCAECNNEPNGVSWSVEVNMNERFTLTEKVQLPQTLQDFYRIIVNQKYFRFFTTYFNPPEDVDYKANSCFYKNNIEEPCTHIGITEKDDVVALVSRLCSVDTAFYHTALYVFKNIFCYLCSNSATSSSLPCESTTRTTTSSFVAILAPMSNIQRLQATSTQGACNCNEYFNPKMGECRDILCPPGTYLALCQCIEFMKLTRLLIQVYIETSPRGYIPELLQPGSNKWLKRFLENMNQLLSNSWAPISMQTTLLFRELSKTDKNYVKLYTILLLQFTDTHADRDNFKRMFDTLLKGVWIKVEKNYLKVQLGLMYEVGRYDTGIFPTHDQFKEADRHLEYIFNMSDLVQPLDLSLHSDPQPLNKLIYCRRVALSDYEVELLKNDTKIKQIYPSLGYVFREEDSTLCLEDYMYMMAESHSSPVFHSRIVALLLMRQTFCLFMM